MSGKNARSEYLGELENKSSLIAYSDARTVREYTSKLNIEVSPPVVRGTGIVCTIGRCRWFIANEIYQKY